MAMETRDRNAMALAALRISVGMLFLIFGDYKVLDKEFIWRGGFQFWINRFITDGAYPPIYGTGSWHFHPSSQHLRADLHADVAVLLNYPGPQAAFWQYFGASLDHSVL